MTHHYSSDRYRVIFILAGTVPYPGVTGVLKDLAGAGRDKPVVTHRYGEARRNSCVSMRYATDDQLYMDHCEGTVLRWCTAVLRRHRTV